MYRTAGVTPHSAFLCKFLKSVPVDLLFYYLVFDSSKCCRYCVEVLASLPFTSPDEPLYLVYDINRFIQIRAGAIESNLKNWTTMDQQQDMVGIPGYTGSVMHEPVVTGDVMHEPGDTGDVMHEPGGYPDQNLAEIPQTALNNSCSTSGMDMAKLQVGFKSFWSKDIDRISCCTMVTILTCLSRHFPLNCPLFSGRLP